MVRAVRSLNCLVAAGEDRASTTKAGACETLDNISKPWTLFHDLNGTIAGQRARVAELLGVEWIHIWLVGNVTLSESEGTAIESICDLYDRLPVESSFEGRVYQWVVCLIMLRVVHNMNFSFCLALMNVVDYALSLGCWLVSHFGLSCYRSVMVMMTAALRRVGWLPSFPIAVVIYCFVCYSSPSVKVSLNIHC